MKEYILTMFEKIPLIGGLVNCTFTNHRFALQEWAINVGGALAPLWFGAVIIYIIEPTNGTGYWNILVKSIIGGELFIYSASLISPILYIALCERKGTVSFPTKISHIALMMIVLTLASVLLSLRKAGVSLNENNVKPLSLYVFIASNILLYLAYVYDNSTTNPLKKFKEEDDSFSESLKRHRS